MLFEEEAYLAHYGTPRKSGRYPYGSGGNDTGLPRNASLLDQVNEMRKQGLSEKDIAAGLGMTTTQLRDQKTIEKNAKRQADIGMAQRLKNKGYSNVAIGDRLGINESSVRSLLAPGQQDKTNVLHTTAAMLKEQVDAKGLIDVGSGVSNTIGVSSNKLGTAVALLKDKGYTLHYIKVEQLGTGKFTTHKVLAPPNTPWVEVNKNRDNIKQIASFSEDGGRSYLGILPPLSVDSKRIGVRYAEDGGAQADGVIYVRPGVADISLGASRYAQVRVSVDGTHFLKGMAMYKDDLPPGHDLVFNTNKSNSGNKKDAFKELKDDPDNPFGATIRQITKKHPDGREEVTSAMNIVNEEGDWDKWSKSLSSQMLSKQSPTFAKQQLDLTYKTKKDELDEILSLTNPAVRRKLLESYSDGVDSSAVHLKAASLPNTANRVILPIDSLKDNEVYSPTHRNGEKVVLIRHPHGGIFEIPELTVNNNHPEAKKLLGRVPDAIGINHKVAEKLSGADFDGDTVLVIPNRHGQVKTAPTLSALKDFDTKAAYPSYEGMPRMTPRQKAVEMGEISNLITDMTIRGANTAELSRAVRHSMVVIDAEKHHLNYKQSAQDHAIKQLKAKYQNGANKGASTLISRAGAEVRIANRKPRPAAEGGPIDRKTGKKVFVDANDSFIGKDGKVVVRKFKSKKLAETDDASTLSSGTKIEKVYVDHSNKLKALANEARRSMINTKSVPYSSSAKTAYQKEVASLNAKLNIALKNRPLERHAQVVANATLHAKRQANPDMDPATVKKIKSQALTEARTRVGAHKQHIELTDSEWAAIQAGAITNSKLTQILNNSNLDQVKKLATPKATILMTPGKTQRAQAMLSAGYTQAEVADALGVSLTTLKRSIGGDG